ncbi:hypothetical protein VNO77_26998 [Canavalia gladiata]|uniref:Uncharacterized protein n=1 Tax=Canavalia gladiata TaxID=3824 RepID=A0AAN9KUK3_CANGL
MHAPRLQEMSMHKLFPCGLRRVRDNQLLDFEDNFLHYESFSAFLFWYNALHGEPISYGNWSPGGSNPCPGACPGGSDSSAVPLGHTFMLVVSEETPTCRKASHYSAEHVLEFSLESSTICLVDINLFFIMSAAIVHVQGHKEYGVGIYKIIDEPETPIPPFLDILTLVCLEQSWDIGVSSTFKASIQL